MQRPSKYIIVYFSSGVVYKDSSLMSGAQRRKFSTSVEEAPNSQPSKWPGQ